MPKVELIYDADCPNVAAARTALMRAFGEAGVSPRWSEHLAAEAPTHARGLGSPTILVDEKDVAAGSEAPRACCRVYETGDGALAGVPDVGPIARAIRESADSHAERGSTGAGWRSSLPALPAILAAVLPKVTCPACWPAYAGVLGALGITFLLDAAVLFGLTAASLMVAIGMLAFRARRRRGFGPFALGVVASALVMIGKFVFESDSAMYVGIATLVAASLWNAWPKRPALTCQECPSTGD